MSDMQNAITAKLLSTLIEERIKNDVVFDLLVEKEIITKEELTKMYQEKLLEKREEYSAESLGMTIEEYKKIVK